MKLFSKSFKERRLFEKRGHPKTFIIFLSMSCFQTVPHRCPFKAAGGTCRATASRSAPSGPAGRCAA
ncbi:hypothetical protein CXP35_05090 [Komagataeibacter xylinus]|nr:hypothetical protein CXP35_05090 [Komagataeibacter xylinus]